MLKRVQHDGRAADVRRALRHQARPAKAKVMQGFFKTGPGQYGEGDIFLGVSVPDQRIVARQFRDLPLPEVKKLLTSRVHEERLTALIILVSQFKRGDEGTQERIYDFYLQHTKWINNWELIPRPNLSSVHGSMGNHWHH